MCVGERFIGRGNDGNFPNLDFCDLNLDPKNIQAFNVIDKM